MASVTLQAPGMPDQINGATAAGLVDMIMEQRTVDADDGSGAFPARPVARVLAVAQARGDRAERPASGGVDLLPGPATGHG